MNMKALSIGFVALFGVLSSGCIEKASAKEARMKADPAPFTLDAQTTIKNGIREYAETVYTFRSGARELWRITLNDRYAHHWISPEGQAWVLTSSMVGPGGGARLWVRDVQGNLLAGWQAPMSGILRPDREEQYSFGASSLVQLNPGSGSNQLRLITKNGSTWRYTLAQTSLGMLALSRSASAKDQDLLSDQLSKSYSPPSVTFPLGPQAGLSIWSFNTSQGTQSLEEVVQSSGLPNERAPMRIVHERALAAVPAYVARTPAGHTLEFTFSIGKREARLDVLGANGQLLKSIDLLALGHFATVDSARRDLRFRSVDQMRGENYGIAIEDADYTSYGSPEELRFFDRSGREYRVKIGAGEQPSIEARASLNLKPQRLKVEPSYPAADLISEKRYVSPDRRFTARVRQYSSKGYRPVVLTLIASVDDPVAGKATAEVWSSSIPGVPEQVYVSNSGRIFALEEIKLSNAQSPPTLLLLNIYEAKGTQIGLDPVAQKWVSNVAEGKECLRLSEMATSIEGPEAEADIDGSTLR